MNKEAAKQALEMGLLGFLSDVDSFFIGVSKTELQADPHNPELKAERDLLRRNISLQCVRIREFIPSLKEEVSEADPELSLIQNKCMVLKELRGQEWTAACKELWARHRERFLHDIATCKSQGSGYSDTKMYGVSLQYNIAWSTYCRLFEGTLFREGTKWRSLKDVKGAWEQSRLTGELP